MINRQQFGHVISKTFRGVRRINQSRYFVKSQSGNGKYEVSLTKIGWLCSCADHKFRGIRCKHVYEVEFSFAIRETVQQEVVIQPISQLACRYCNSEHIVKKAIRRNKQYNIQRYLCKIAVNDSRLILGSKKCGLRLMQLRLQCNSISLENHLETSCDFWSYGGFM